MLAVRCADGPPPWRSSAPHNLLSSPTPECCTPPPPPPPARALPFPLPGWRGSGSLLGSSAARKNSASAFSLRAAQSPPRTTVAEPTPARRRGRETHGGPLGTWNVCSKKWCVSGFRTGEALGPLKLPRVYSIQQPTAPVVCLPPAAAHATAHGPPTRAFDPRIDLLEHWGVFQHVRQDLCMCMRALCMRAHHRSPHSRHSFCRGVHGAEKEQRRARQNDPPTPNQPTTMAAAPCALHHRSVDRHGGSP